MKGADLIAEDTNSCGVFRHDLHHSLRSCIMNQALTADRFLWITALLQFLEVFLMLLLILLSVLDVAVYDWL